VTSVAPSAVTTHGGALLTISGANFSGAATVLVGGTAATQVTVVNGTTITATAPAHDPGSADVIVTINGQSASLPAAVTFVANAPPVIASIVVRGSKPREPAQFADLDEPVSVTATVTDAETPVANLEFTWSSDVGSFSGSGPTVTWVAPHSYSTPADVMLGLTVVERFQANTAGTVVSGENRVTGASKVRLHNSVKEVGDLAVDFLTGFSEQLAPRWMTVADRPQPPRLSLNRRAGLQHHDHQQRDDERDHPPQLALLEELHQLPAVPSPLATFFATFMRPSPV
jgi:hypothetical protein